MNTSEQPRMMGHHQIPEKMMEGDLFSQWLGIIILVSEPGRCVLKMKVRKEMLNGFGILHGGVSFSLADSAFAFASNSQGRKSFSIDNSISYLHKVQEGDELMAEAKELSLTEKFGWYSVSLTNQENRVVAIFKGTVYRSKEIW